jgi:hypothetical protein
MAETTAVHLVETLVSLVEEKDDSLVVKKDWLD